MEKAHFASGACWWLILVFTLLGWRSLCPAQTTYYVRMDGGTATQCTGLSDAPYSGSGIGKACSWAHPFWGLDSSGNWKISGGDTLIIGPGDYRMGLGAPNTGWCHGEGAFDCHLPPLPSGPDAAHPTGILGAGWNQGCVDAPELWGAERPWQILNLDGTSNAVIQCLEITDHSECVEGHPDLSVQCQRNTPPFGNWASAGIYAADASNILLKDLNIHGLASHGVWAGRLSDWTVMNVRIAGNGWVGWDGDVDHSGGGSACTGEMIFRSVTVEWNGCGETYPGQTPHGCWAQTAGGWGDGVGLNTTGGDWLVEDSIIRNNTSDGLDMLYVRLDPSNIQIKRTQAYGNAGDQIKVNGPGSIENSQITSNCGFFEGKSFTYHVDNCRAGGSALALNLRKGNRVSVINSTIAGQGDCLCLVECDGGDCKGSETLIVQNNIFMGHKEFGTPSDRACYIWFEPSVFGTVNADYNVVFDTKIGNVALASHDLNQNPLVVDASLETFDGRLQPGSPAMDSGVPVGGLGGLVPDHDLENVPRPAGSGVDRGAYERAVGCPPCSGAAPCVENWTFPAGSDCICRGTVSITVGPNVTVANGASVTFLAPMVTIESGLHTETGATIRIRQP